MKISRYLYQLTIQNLTNSWSVMTHPFRFAEYLQMLLLIYMQEIFKNHRNATPVFLEIFVYMLACSVLHF